jgi:hypothetical protein
MASLRFEKVRERKRDGRKLEEKEMKRTIEKGERRKKPGA